SAGADDINIRLRYSTALFKRSSIEKMVDHFTGIARKVVENPGIKLEDIDVSLDLSAGQSNILAEAQGDFEF
ncbi:MAG: hypothetical protein GY940_42225, partial [bacterium]|nr:hypothetical protein [bacterium]